jgi:hypothetical protein
MRKGNNDPDNYPTVETLAEGMGIPKGVLNLWLASDGEFRKGLATVKRTYDNDPLKDAPDDEIKLDAATLSFGIVFVLEETKKRYGV